MSIEDYAQTLIDEQASLALKFGINSFSQADKEMIVEQLNEFPETELDEIMTDPLARASLAGAMVTLICLVSADIMYVTEEELEKMGIQVNETEAPEQKKSTLKKKSDTTH